PTEADQGRLPDRRAHLRPGRLRHLAAPPAHRHGRPQRLGHGRLTTTEHPNKRADRTRSRLPAPTGPVGHHQPFRKDVAAMKATHKPPIVDESLGTSPAELLRGAALYLRSYGWTQHQFYDMVADTAGPFPPACTSGAIM